jgi:hypothetical protein
MLAEIYNWFTEGFDTADLKDAKALLDAPVGNLHDGVGGDGRDAGQCGEAAAYQPRRIDADDPGDAGSVGRRDILRCYRDVPGTDAGGAGLQSVRAMDGVGGEETGERHDGLTDQHDPYFFCRRGSSSEMQSAAVDFNASWRAAPWDEAAGEEADPSESLYSF